MSAGFKCADWGEICVGEAVIPFTTELSDCARRGPDEFKTARTLRLSKFTTFLKTPAIERANLDQEEG